jgi:glycosyltransferase involved in cell wall biosynthesis
VFKVLYSPFNVVAGNSKSVTNSLEPLTFRSRLITLDNGIDLDRFDQRSSLNSLKSLPCENGKVIISVGRLLPQKGHLMLVEAFFMIAEKYKNLSLFIIGDGPLKKELQSKIFSLGLTDRVFLLGFRDDVPALLLKASIFANASRWEGMSNAVLEAMAASLPSVVIDAPGVSECHQAGITGLVVGPTPEELAEGLINLLENTALAAGMGLAARRHVREHYSMESNRRRFLELFTSLIRA